MKKIILLPILILIMSFGMINNVNAESCTPIYNIINNNTTFQTTYVGQNYNQIDLLFSNSIQLNQYEYYKIPYVLVNNYIQDYSSKTIDLKITCTNPQWTSATGSATITYADGTRASISSTEWDTYCKNYNTISKNDSTQDATIFGYSYNTTNDIILRFAMLGNNNQNIIGPYTEIDKNTNTFKIFKSNDTASGMRIILEVSNFNTVSYRYGLSRPLLFGCNSDTQRIINNQNQNATQQHNDSNAINNNITNTYNFISSDSIESTTNTDDITNQYDSTSNNNVLNFMLIPINFVNSIITGFGNSCSQVCLGNCSSGGFHDNFNFTFVMPCIDIRSVIGNDIYNTIDSLMCVAMIFAFIRSVVGFAKKALLLEADVSSEVRVF